MKKDQSGYIAVETITAFMLFVFFVTSILSLINIVVVQARMHYALAQAASAVSMYDYCLEVTGLADDIMSMAEKGGKTRTDVNTFTGNINTVLDGISTIAGSRDLSTSYSAAQNAYNAGSAAYNQAEKWINTANDDPKEMISQILTLGVTELGGVAFQGILRPLVGHFLTNGSMDGEEYLRSMNVIDGLDGLQFYTFLSNSSSSAMTEDGNVEIRVTYDVEYKFGTLPIPFAEPKLTITQTVVTKAWLGGAGKGYSP